MGRKVSGERANPLRVQVFLVSAINVGKAPAARGSEQTMLGLKKGALVCALSLVTGAAALAQVPSTSSPGTSTPPPPTPTPPQASPETFRRSSPAPSSAIRRPRNIRR
jgi:hypothetical protein